MAPSGVNHLSQPCIYGTLSLFLCSILSIRPLPPTNELELNCSNFSKKKIKIRFLHIIELVLLILLVLAFFFFLLQVLFFFWVVCGNLGLVLKCSGGKQGTLVLRTQRGNHAS